MCAIWGVRNSQLAARSPQPVFLRAVEQQKNYAESGASIGYEKKYSFVH